jgi:hypothetical protein
MKLSEAILGGGHDDPFVAAYQGLTGAREPYYDFPALLRAIKRAWPEAEQPVTYARDGWPISGWEYLNLYCHPDNRRYYLDGKREMRLLVEELQRHNL